MNHTFDMKESFRHGLRLMNPVIKVRNKHFEIYANGQISESLNFYVYFHIFLTLKFFKKIICFRRDVKIREEK